MNGRDRATKGSARTTRREFLKHTGTLAAASALAGVAIPRVHAAGNSTIQIALVGCGGRGTDAAGNALSVKGGGTKLVSRRGLAYRHPFTDLGSAIALELNADDAVLDGEIVKLDETGRPIFLDMMRRRGPFAATTTGWKPD